MIREIGGLNIEKYLRWIATVRLLRRMPPALAMSRHESQRATGFRRCTAPVKQLIALGETSGIQKTPSMLPITCSDKDADTRDGVEWTQFAQKNILLAKRAVRHIYYSSSFFI